MKSTVKFIYRHYLVLGGVILLFSWIVERYVYDKWDSRIASVQQHMLHVNYLKLESEITSARGSIEATLSILCDKIENVSANGVVRFRPKETRDEYVYIIPDIGYNVRKYNKLIYDSMANTLGQLVACLPKDQNADIYIELDSLKSVIRDFLSSPEIYDLSKSKIIDESANALLRKTVARLNNWLRETFEAKQRWRKVFSVLYVLGTLIIIFGRLNEMKRVAEIQAPEE